MTITSFRLKNRLFQRRRRRVVKATLFRPIWWFLCWSGWQGSNLRPHAPKARALPAALHPDFGQSNMAMVFTSPVFRFLMMARMAVQETTSHLVGSSPSMVNHLFCATVGFFPCFIPIPPKRNRNLKSWWRWRGSNSRHPACKAGALPTELHPQINWT